MKPHNSKWREKLHTIIFEAETPSGHFFDVALLWMIILSVLAVIVESISSVRQEWGGFLYGVEWFLTIVFTIEYVLRILSVRQPLKYITSFLGVVDLLAILPTYLSVFLPGSQSLLVIRVIRLLRVFRLFKLTRYIGEAQVLIRALKAATPKITVFLGAVLSTVLILGSMMYLLEGSENGFENIPKAVYWAIVTMTTVGYGDIVPTTPLGQALASLIMILGYGIIAVPTGIVSVEIANATRTHTTITCPSCSVEGHDSAAKFCRFCGEKL